MQTVGLYFMHTKLTAELNSAHNEYTALDERYALLDEEHAVCIEGSNNLLDRLTEEEERNEDFEDQIRDLAGTVNILDKLAKTDKELLQKYSKVYFLNEHYVPPRVAEIDKKYVVNNDGFPEYVHASIADFVEDMLERAERDGIELRVVSAYRSFDEQAQLKGGYTITYGSGANAFSADQGYSEHQLGTTIDFSSPEVNNALVTQFDTTAAYAWLEKNAYRYGFTLSYPQGNAYYVYEPWHWRFVGTDLAGDLRRSGKSFYDLEQREIDEYLVNLFD